MYKAVKNTAFLPQCKLTDVCKAPPQIEVIVFPMSESLKIENAYSLEMKFHKQQRSQQQMEGKETAGTLLPLVMAEVMTIKSSRILRTSTRSTCKKQACRNQTKAAIATPEQGYFPGVSTPTV